ncbi:glutamine--tRNA ligase [Blochmannia endosymbiont of Camponotus (Colobopsis) obliquus]|uniref:glutamine--tRNA ligase n=1 Tax=Blochmannia endosymbiont of Camponotus (Colobopsis) obliquus TaxID=1505597 RepID=UPI00061A5CA5|nr:glutamine--tRNA ligase [Blochmannia endosymbiont of Camponotus (Colobopsis) obliquus]AKC60487.1 glutamine--tRNA ligase [Blochmannia endosymbiont of Camponotus (Colobopsis) obliquus]
MKRPIVYRNNFIYQIIEKDLSLDKSKIIRTRFPPEPNGYLHVGHAKSICLNFGVVQYYHGQCYLRFDDTNPVNEDIQYVEAIKNDIVWLGFQWHGDVRYASDYSEKLYNYAVELINKGLAYVDELSPNKIREYRGTLVLPGKNSPYRSRHIKENLMLFTKMRQGYFAEGKACLRAKIDMSSPYMIMRDPVLYRIKFIHHQRVGDKWCIYPTYDFTHCISDALEGITHSLCTLEFQDNRRLYDWILNKININVHPRQYEFSRLNLEYAVMSKRKLDLLVLHNIVTGWDDPRMPTISGLRRRGYTPESIREFCYRIGVTKQESCINMAALEACIRKDLNDKVSRVMAVLDPIKIIINNLPDKYEEKIVALNHPNKLDMGTRQIFFTKEIFIDRNDFCEIVNDYKIRKLILGKKIRLRNAYVIQAERVQRDNNGAISIIFCTYDSQTLNKNPIDCRDVKGVIHWVSATRNVIAEFRLYNHLFTISNPWAVKNFLSYVNPRSLVIYHGFVEDSVLYSKKNKHYQFEREGYFCIDECYSTANKLVFHRTVELKSIWKTKNNKKIL